MQKIYIKANKEKKERKENILYALCILCILYVFDAKITTSAPASSFSLFPSLGCVGFWGCFLTAPRAGDGVGVCDGDCIGDGSAETDGVTVGVLLGGGVGTAQPDAVSGLVCWDG